MPRLFTAIEIPRDAALCLSFLRGGLPSARWIDTENYHLTLRFIGDVDCRTADEVVAELDRVARPSFELTLRGVGAFGSKKPHSIYAGAVPSPGLDTLQAEHPDVAAKVKDAIAAYDSPRDFFVQRVAEGVATIAAAELDVSGG